LSVFVAGLTTVEPVGATGASVLVPLETPFTYNVHVPAAERAAATCVHVFKGRVPPETAPQLTPPRIRYKVEPAAQLPFPTERP